MWWHAIRAAWPEYHIPDPEHLKQRVEWVITPWEERNDNSLKALNYARNLLLYVSNLSALSLSEVCTVIFADSIRGFRPELARDLGNLRETVWEEVRPSSQFIDFHRSDWKIIQLTWSRLRDWRTRRDRVIWLFMLIAHMRMRSEDEPSDLDQVDREEWQGGFISEST